MSDAELAASFAIFAAKQLGDKEVTPDHILIGCLRAVSRFGIANIGAWSVDLETLGVDWVRQPENPQPKVAYSQEAVDLFDRAAQIAKSMGGAGVNVSALLAAFAASEAGLMGELKRVYGITSASWRAAVARRETGEATGASSDDPPRIKKQREYLTPEEAAEELGVHVQTMRGYIRSGRMPAFRVAGERAIRILRADLRKVLEPLEGKGMRNDHAVLCCET
jgi:excisionase family DNA binding protein